MNSTQRLVKYLAIGFAIFLSVTIISSIVGGVLFLLNLTSDKKEEKTVDFTSEFEEDIENIEIDGYIYTIKIKQGDQLKVDLTNVSENFTSKVKNKTLKIGYSGTRGDLFSFLDDGKVWNESGYVTITIPSDLDLNKLKIDTGVGELFIDDVTAQYLDLNMGTGSITGSNFSISQETIINCGAGSIEFNNVAFHNCDIDLGVGSTYVQGDLTGETDIDGGVGDLTLSLTKPSNDYSLQVDSGLGDITINKEKYSSQNWNNKNADHLINIDGGLGDITLDFAQ